MPITLSLADPAVGMIPDPMLGPMPTRRRRPARIGLNDPRLAEVFGAAASAWPMASADWLEANRRVPPQHGPAATQGNTVELLRAINRTARLQAAEQRRQAAARQQIRNASLQRQLQNRILQQNLVSLGGLVPKRFGQGEGWRPRVPGERAFDPSEVVAMEQAGKLRLGPWSLRDPELRAERTRYGLAQAAKRRAQLEAARPKPYGSTPEGRAWVQGNKDIRQQTRVPREMRPIEEIWAQAAMRKAKRAQSRAARLSAVHQFAAARRLGRQMRMGEPVPLPGGGQGGMGGLAQALITGGDPNAARIGLGLLQLQQAGEAGGRQEALERARLAQTHELGLAGIEPERVRAEAARTQAEAAAARATLQNRLAQNKLLQYGQFAGGWPEASGPVMPFEDWSEAWEGTPAGGVPLPPGSRVAYRALYAKAREEGNAAEMWQYGGPAGYSQLQIANDMQARGIRPPANMPLVRSGGNATGQVMPLSPIPGSPRHPARRAPPRAWPHQMSLLGF